MARKSAHLSAQLQSDKRGRDLLIIHNFSLHPMRAGGMGYTSCNLLKIDRNTWCTGVAVVDPPLRR